MPQMIGTVQIFENPIASVAKRKANHFEPASALSKFIQPFV